MWKRKTKGRRRVKGELQRAFPSIRWNAVFCFHSYVVLIIYIINFFFSVLCCTLLAEKGTNLSWRREAESYVAVGNAEQDNRIIFAGFEILIAVVMNSYCIFWYITPCSPFKVNRCCGEVFRLHVQRWTVRQTRNQHEAGSKQNMKDGGDMLFRNVGWLSVDYVALYPRI
jgi:hypothetical protein